MLQNPRKTLGFKKNMVYKIPPGGGGKPYPASGLIRHTINPMPSQSRYYRLEQLDLRFVLQVEWCITLYIRAQILKQPFNALKPNTQSAQMQSRTSARGSFLLHQSF